MNHQTLRRSTLLVMHSDAILCAGLVAAFRAHTDFEVFVHGADHPGAASRRVDVVIADHAAAIRSTDAGTRAQLGLHADTRVLALTRKDREADIRRALQAGVHGYVLLGGPLDELVAAAKALAHGQRYMSVAVARRVADSLARASLTRRETEVLQLVAGGHPNKAIARQLRIQLCTVKSHVSAIMAKLGAVSRTQAARIADARGLLEKVPEAGAGPVPSPAHSRPVARAAQYGSPLSEAAGSC